MAKVKKKRSILPDNKFIAVIISLILPAAIFVFWYFGSEKAIFNASIIPSPHKIVVQFQKMVSDGSLVDHIVTSFKRVLMGLPAGSRNRRYIGNLYRLIYQAESAFYRFNRSFKTDSANCLHTTFYYDYGLLEKGQKIAFDFYRSILAVPFEYNKRYSFYESEAY